MESLTAFIRLLRPINLAIIALTMYAMRWGLQFSLLIDSSVFSEFQLSEFHFVLSVIVMVLLAGAGNLINDYFDVKVDRLNKPEKVLVGRKVKRRVVMVGHHGFNIIATLITAYLGYYHGNLWLIAIPVLMAASLWFYSMVFKRQFWIGNFVVALIVGIVPIWSGMLELPLIAKTIQVIGGDGSSLTKETWIWLIGYSLFAFLLTLVREVIKDMEDIRGDKAAGFDTLPIRWGIKNGKKYTFVLLSVLLCGFSFSLWSISKFTLIESNSVLFCTLFAAAVIVPFLITWFYLARAKNRNGFHHSSTWSKWTMAGGI
ncbi:MAG: 4-hydroxybenzoate polyprenyltransferase, partial [Flavobacteriales bacterium]